MKILTLANVTLKFGGVAAISDLSFSVNEGETVGLIGPNGAGKTTALNAISGLLHPSSGSITFSGRVITTERPHRIAHLGVARTFQIVQPFKGLTVVENVAVPAMFSRKKEAPSRGDALEHAFQALKQVGLTGKAQALPDSLTLSERKRLELARALAMKPRLLLLDEVMAGLNHAEIESLVELIKGIGAAGLSILVVEHVMKVIVALAHRVVVLNFGEKIADAAPDAVLRDERVVGAYLGSRHSMNAKSNPDGGSNSGYSHVSA